MKKEQRKESFGRNKFIKTLLFFSFEVEVAIGLGIKLATIANMTQAKNYT